MPGTPPPGNPASSAPGRTATDARSRDEGTPGPRASVPASVLALRLEPLRQPAAQDRHDRAVADTDNPRAVDPPPSAASERRIPARHANRRTQRREHRPHPLPPRLARRPPPRSRTARSSTPPEFRSCQPDVDVDRAIRLGRGAAPGTRPSRTAPADGVPHQPRPSSPPRGSCRRRPARSRTDRGWRCAAGPSMSARARTSAPQSGHVAGSGNRTSTANCARQPRHSPATVSRRAGFIAGRCAPSSRLPLISPPPRAQCRPSELPAARVHDDVQRIDLGLLHPPRRVRGIVRLGSSTEAAP